MTPIQRRRLVDALPDPESIRIFNDLWVLYRRMVGLDYFIIAKRTVSSSGCFAIKFKPGFELYGVLQFER